MKTVKCRQCNFVNSEFSENCRKCRATLRNTLEYYANPATKHKLKWISLSQILKNDYFAFLAACFPAVVWVLCIGVQVFGLPEKNGRIPTAAETRNIKLIALAAAVLLTILGATFIYRRVKSVRRIFATGEWVMGTVNFIEFEKDRGRIEYSYQYRREVFQSGTAIMKNSRTKDFHVGDELILIVDKADPKRTLIPDLYCR